MPDQSAQIGSSSPAPFENAERVADGIPLARTKTSGNGDSRGAAGEGCRHKYRVQVEAEAAAAEDEGREEGSERPRKDTASGRRGRRNDMVVGCMECM
jgi:hypothetical protein